MGRRVALVAVSTVQLMSGVVAQGLALRERRTFDIALIGWKGRPERIGRDVWFYGSGLSAPVSMLVAQAVATLQLARRPSRTAERVLGVLGAAMIGGYLVEREFRSAVSPRGWTWPITPLAATGFLLSAAMVALGLHGKAGD